MFTVNVQNKTYKLDERTPIISLVDNSDKRIYGGESQQQTSRAYLRALLRLESRTIGFKISRRGKSLRNEFSLFISFGFSQSVSRLSAEDKLRHFKVDNAYDNIA